MASPYNPPVSGEDFVCHIALEDMANPGSFKVNPTIAAGDFKISKNGGALANLATLPTVEPAGSIWVRIELSATEMTTPNAQIQCIDQTTLKEWADQAFTIVTT